MNKLIAKVFADVEIIIAVRWIHSAQVEYSCALPVVPATSESENSFVNLGSVGGFALACVGISDDKSHPLTSEGTLEPVSREPKPKPVDRKVKQGSKLMRRLTANRYIVFLTQGP